MADSPPYPGSDRDPGDDPGAGPDGDSPPSTPRWVKVFAVIALAVVLLVVVLLLAGGGQHGPGRHTGSGDAGARTPPAGVAEDRTPSAGDLGGHAPPDGAPRHSGHQP